MLEDLLPLTPLDPNAVVKALEHVPAAAGDASRALVSAVAGVRGGAMHSALATPPQEGLWMGWPMFAPMTAPADLNPIGDLGARTAQERSIETSDGTLLMGLDLRPSAKVLFNQPLPKGCVIDTVAKPATIRYQPANGWDQIVNPQPVARVSKKATFGDGSVSLWELVMGVNFQVYIAIHAWALVSIICWRSRRLAALCAAMYLLKMFGITGGFHRLLSHRSYKTSRPFQFGMAWLGCCAFQKGPLWWCSHHRHHHRTADTPADPHSPLHSGFWWSHVGWFLCSTHSVDARVEAVPDLMRCPELRWLDKYHYIPPFLLTVCLYAGGGWAAVGWGFMLSNVLCWHATYCINSVAHLVGSRRYSCEFQTHCDARNNALLAVVTLGEGWHNNHHCYMRSAKHGFYPHEIDATYIILRALAALGLVWDLELPPMKQLEQKRVGRNQYACRCHHVETDLQQLQQGEGCAEG